MKDNSRVLSFFFALSCLVLNSNQSDKWSNEFSESYLIIVFGTRTGTLRGKVQLNLVNGAENLFVFLPTIDDKL